MAQRLLSKCRMVWLCIWDNYCHSSEQSIVSNYILSILYLFGMEIIIICNPIYYRGKHCRGIINERFNQANVDTGLLYCVFIYCKRTLNVYFRNVGVLLVNEKKKHIGNICTSRCRDLTRFYNGEFNLNIWRNECKISVEFKKGIKMKKGIKIKKNEVMCKLLGWNNNVTQVRCFLSMFCSASHFIKNQCSNKIELT